jgi:hypothetical protein
MRIAVVIVPVLLGLAAAPALAQETGKPPAARGGQGEMSYKDYLMQRARLLLRMQGGSPQQQPGQAAAGKDGQDSSYGQGYASRKNAQDRTAHPPRDRRTRPGHPRMERPERPRIERPEQPERPGRP